MSNRSVNLIIGLVFFILLGPAFLFFGKMSLQEAKDSAKWPSVKGTIVESKIERKTEYDEAERSTKTYYSPDIVYKYTVGRKHYYGNKLSFNGTCWPCCEMS